MKYLFVAFSIFALVGCTPASAQPQDSGVVMSEDPILYPHADFGVWAPESSTDKVYWTGNDDGEHVWPPFIPPEEIPPGTWHDISDRENEVRLPGGGGAMPLGTGHGYANSEPQTGFVPATEAHTLLAESLM